MNLGLKFGYTYDRPGGVPHCQYTPLEPGRPNVFFNKSPYPSRTPNPSFAALCQTLPSTRPPTLPPTQPPTSPPTLQPTNTEDLLLRMLDIVRQCNSAESVTHPWYSSICQLMDGGDST